MWPMDNDQVVVASLCRLTWRYMVYSNMTDYRRLAPELALEYITELIIHVDRDLPSK